MVRTAGAAFMPDGVMEDTEVIEILVLRAVFD